ncbi:WXG100 family type VII secretion target [Kitasatospora sp. NPDC101157]|uniref:WXG100 family type VII secretion target n=1 Tax=Kitasatospora sp. NPDC101157 TaxID=3364098 RepID=UPI00380F8960
MAGETNFEGLDHSVLHGMVNGTSPQTVLSRGTQLQAAGRVLTELSAALKSHLSNVNWEGQAAENFKTWAGNLQQSAEKLGAYSTGAGNAMHQAGEALSTAKVAMPAVPTTDMDTVSRHAGQTVDQAAYTTAGFMPEGATPANLDSIMQKRKPGWVTQAEFQAASQRVYQAHQEAVHQMENLAQAYAAATTTLNGLGDNVVLPGTPDSSSNKDDSTTASGASGGYAGSGGAIRSPRTSAGSTGGSVRPASGGYSGGSNPATYHETGTGTWDTSRSGPTGPVPPHGGGQLPPPPQDPGSSIPPFHPSDPITRPGTGLDSLPTLPDQTSPVGPGSGPVLPSGPSGTPAYPGGPGGPGSLPGLPGGGPIGGFPGGTSGGSVPTKGIGSVPGKGGGSVPLRTGPFNGGSVPGKAGTPGLPSGTVFGREGAASGGRVGGSSMGSGMGMHPGMGGGHGVGAGGVGGSRGRGLTSTAGGTVGGRKGPAAGGEFTPGGTGLRNRAGAAGAAEGGSRSGQNGMMAPGAGGHGGKKDRDRRNRADYLHEDEETWTSGTPHSNPDVIE